MMRHAGVFKAEMLPNVILPFSVHWRLEALVLFQDLKPILNRFLPAHATRT